jgi:hypothetical protein
MFVFKIGDIIVPYHNHQEIMIVTDAFGEGILDYAGGYRIMILRRGTIHTYSKEWIEEICVLYENV